MPFIKYKLHTAHAYFLVFAAYFSLEREKMQYSILFLFFLIFIFSAIKFQVLLSRGFIFNLLQMMRQAIVLFSINLF